MRKIIVVLLILTLLLSGCQKKEEREFVSSISSEEQNEILDPSGSYRHTLFEGIYIEVSTGTTYELFNSNGTRILEGLFYKYTFNNDGYIAICNLSGVDILNENQTNYINIKEKYGYDKFEIHLFDSNLNTIEIYDSYSDFCKYCKDNSISFEHWYYRGAGYSNRIDLIDSVYIENARVEGYGSRGMTLFINEEPNLIGCISEYAVVDKATVAVRFQEREYEYFLYDSKMKINDGLDRKQFGENDTIKDPHSFNPFKKIKLYEAVIVYELNDGNVTRQEYMNKESVEKALGITCEWINIC